MNATAQTHWVYTQKGYEHSVAQGNADSNDRKPGMPVPEIFRITCPASWVQNGWVEEAEGQVDLFELLG